MSQIKATVPTPLADMPTLDHRDIADNSKPAPSASMISEIAAATKAPPITPPQDMPDEDTSGWEAIDTSEFATHPPMSAVAYQRQSMAARCKGRSNHEQCEIVSVDCLRKFRVRRRTRIQ